jgi:predicted N-formylglutamate amidohydrolase
MKDPLSPPPSESKPAPVEVVNPSGRSTAFLVCDHASARVPEALGSLGLTQDELHQHIGWDIGAAEVARHLSTLLDAPLVLSGYSRLVIDCNRPPGAPTSIAATSGGVAVPGNASVGEAEAQARAETYFWPYHRTIARMLDERLAAGRPAAILSIHSFTPSLLGQARPWPIAMIYGKDRLLAGLLLEALGREHGVLVGDNQPYHVTDEGDYGIPVHAERRALPGVLVELRQDEVGSPLGARAWAERLSRLYREIEPRLGFAGR